MEREAGPKTSDVTVPTKTRTPKVPQAKTGKELVAFLRQSPLNADELDLERDRSTGRYADFD